MAGSHGVRKVLILQTRLGEKEAHLMAERWRGRVHPMASKGGKEVEFRVWVGREEMISQQAWQFWVVLCSKVTPGVEGFSIMGTKFVHVMRQLCKPVSHFHFPCALQQWPRAAPDVCHFAGLKLFTSLR